MSSLRWRWSPCSGIQYLLPWQSGKHNIPCHGLQSRSLHFPQCSAARPLHCRRSSYLRTIFENPIGSWNLPERKHVGLPDLIKTLFQFRLHPCKQVLLFHREFYILFSFKHLLVSIYNFRNIKRPFHICGFCLLDIKLSAIELINAVASGT